MTTTPSPSTSRRPSPTTARRALLSATTAVLLLAMAALGGADAPVRAIRAIASPTPTAADTTAETAVASASDTDQETSPPDASALDGAPAGAADHEVTAPVPVPADDAAQPTEPPAADPASAPAIEPWSVEVHGGLGAWIDIYDWSVWGSGGTPPVTLDTVDALAEQGVRTLYVQTARINVPDAVVEPERLQALIDRAHEHGMFVVGWYMPTFVDVDEDLRRIEAAMAMDIDGFALDIESQEVLDTDVRTERLLQMSRRMREVAGDRVLVANPLPPVQMEELAPSLWPDFPWAELGEYYDVFMPMGYFTFREDGHEWRDAEAYTAENVRRIRERVGDPDLPVHFIGGIADLTTVEDVRGMTRGAEATGAIGLSLYDVATTGTELWEPMQAWRDLG